MVHGTIRARILFFHRIAEFFYSSTKEAFMPDNKSITHPLDAKRIDINDSAEVANWCSSFKCTEAQLKVAVNAVGTSGAEVRKHLEK
jgi:hypothetical protein